MTEFPKKPGMTGDIWCCACDQNVKARLTNGDEIYPHRRDLGSLPFWKCDLCDNYVGCHSNTTHPLGCIPTPAIRKIRIEIHSYLDPLWKKGKIKRRDLYKALSEKLGYKYHSADIKSLEEASIVLEKVKELSK